MFAAFVATSFFNVVFAKNLLPPGEGGRVPRGRVRENAEALRNHKQPMFKPNLTRQILLALALMPTFAHAQNAAPIFAPVPNGSFENADTLTRWTLSQNDNSQGSAQISADAQGGTRALRIVKTNSDGYALLTSDFIPVKPQTDYLVTARVKSKTVSFGKVNYMISQYDAESDQMRFPNQFSPSGTLESGGEWNELKFRFQVRQNTRAKIHLIIEGSRIDFLMDDVTVRELRADEAYNPRYEKPTPEVLPPLESVMSEVKARPLMRGERRVVDGRPRLFANGKPLAPAFLTMSYSRPELNNIADFARVGIHTFVCYLPLNELWTSKGKFDFAPAEARMWRVLRADPQAQIIFYFQVDPYDAWGEENLDDVSVNQNGQRVIVENGKPRFYATKPDPTKNYTYGPSLHSARLRDDTNAIMRQFFAALDESIPGRAVVGAHIIGYNDGQFYQWSNGENLADYSPAALASYKDWLRAKYKTDAALSQAWGRDVSFDAVQIPSGEARKDTAFLRDPIGARDLMDFERFSNEGGVDLVKSYARTIKEASRNRLLVSTYYEDAASNATNTHMALGALLESDDIDFVAGPASYSIRMPGYVGAAHGTWGSTALHGRLYLTEQDWRTWKSESYGGEGGDFTWGRTENAEGFAAMVRRESGMMLAFGQGTWWYDMHGGWFSDAELMKPIAEAKRAFDLDLKTKGAPRADVAVFLSEPSLDALGGGVRGVVHNAAVVNQIRILNASGVPYHLYLQSDLASPNLPDYKLYLFLNPHVISPDEFAAMEKLKRDGHTLLWQHAPGAADPASVGANTQSEAIGKITGIGVAAKDDGFLVINPKGSSAYVAGFAPDEPLTAGALSGPMFRVQDEKAQVFGAFEDGDAGAAMREFGNWKSIFFGGIGLSGEFLNDLARASGAWVAAKPGDAVYANSNFITVHALRDGRKTLTLAAPSQVTDLTSGDVVSKRAATIELDMKRGETRWFALEP